MPLPPSPAAFAPLDPALPPVRLALAHARSADRAIWRTAFALDARLADVGARTSQPLITQVRLAWWRDRFAEPAARWPAGEPLLADLADWDSERAALTALVNGWESELLEDNGAVALAAARTDLFEAMGRMVGTQTPEGIAPAVRDWLDPHHAGAAPRLDRAMRPLAILRGLAVIEARPGGKLARLVRLMVLGR